MVSHKKMKRIGEGIDAEIYSFGNNEILKLFYNYEGVEEWVEREVAKNRMIERMDLPVPRVKKCWKYPFLPKQSPTDGGLGFPVILPTQFASCAMRFPSP